MKKLNVSGNQKNVGLGLNASAAKNLMMNSANGDLGRMNLTLLE